MLVRLLIFLAGVLLGLPYGVILASHLVAKAHRVPSSPAAQPVQIFALGQLSLEEAQRMAARLRLQ